MVRIGIRLRFFLVFHPATERIEWKWKSRKVVYYKFTLTYPNNNVIEEARPIPQQVLYISSTTIKYITVYVSVLNVMRQR